MKNFRVSYDDEQDILYIAREGREMEVVEIAPGINVELDASGSLIGVEVLRASSVFKKVIRPMEKRLREV